ncbi:MAG: alkaline phosphatase family protein [Alphaproteobacteria bacterium]|nr:alkaline phosphatase family protein [Alphaproteobacteria bacterium]
MAKKNVLLIVVDQWRGDHLPHLGFPNLRTPNVDRLCREGVTFRNHYTTTAPCGPARASLLTGLYQMNHRAVQNTVPLDARHDNLGKALRRAGYDPALVGYTTTTPDPRTTGHDDPRFRILGDLMDGFRSVGAFEPAMDAYFGWVAAHGYKLPPNRNDIWLPAGADATPGPTTLASRIPAELSDSRYFTERALTYLKGRRSPGWFLHLGYYRPHPQFIAPAPFNALYDPAAMLPPVRAASPEAEARQHPLARFYVEEIQQSGFFQGAQGRGCDLTREQIAAMRASYLALMTELDEQLGRVFAHLDATDQWRDTLVIFTCDHGEQLGDHHLLGKIGYFDASFHIPMIVRDPSPAADATRGTIVEHFTETIDTFPTIMEWPFTMGAAPSDWRTEAHYEFDFRDVFYSKPEATLGVRMDDCSLAVVRDHRYKYVHFATLPPLFFDLTRDPQQLDNRAADSAYAPLVRDYAQKMLGWRLRHAERTLTHYRATPDGLEARA